PVNYRPVYETRFYRVWRKAGPAPRAHLPFGSDGQQGVGLVRCRRGRPVRPALRQLAQRAEAAHAQLAVSLGGAEPRTLVRGLDWIRLVPGHVIPPDDQSAGYGGLGSTVMRVKPGRYTLWLQGSYGPGV